MNKLSKWIDLAFATSSFCGVMTVIFAAKSESTVLFLIVALAALAHVYVIASYIVRKDEDMAYKEEVRRAIHDLECAKFVCQDDWYRDRPASIELECFIDMAILRLKG